MVDFDPTMNDADLNMLSIQVADEKTRRSSLVDLPKQITTVSKSFLAYGGDIQVLHDAVNAAVPPQQ